MPELPQSTRRVLKATFVPINVNVDVGVFTTGRAIQKYGYVRQLNLQPGEVAAVSAAAVSTRNPSAQAIAALSQKLTLFEGAPLPSQLPARDFFANSPIADLLAFGKALSALRTDRLNQLTTSTAPTAAPAAAAADQKTLATHLLNTSLNATNGLDHNSNATPIGMLNLERLEMTPAGIDRGELIATIPLAPLEQTAVVQKEWSVTTKEFTSIVTDSLENYSETGVTENTELAQSTTSQVQHSNQFNVNATVSGSVNYATIASASAKVGTRFTTQDQNSSSAADSTKHATATTKKASTRVKQEHKVTISTTSVTGASETSTRNLQDPSPTDPMRIDYFSLMRRWHVGLYRYGLRLTYDIVIPEPGGTLRETYATLDSLTNLLSNQFVFPYKHFDISTDTKPGDTEPYYLVLADKYGVDVPSPPGPTIIINVNVGFTHNTEFPGHPASFNVPAGYWIEQILYLSWHAGSTTFDFSVFVDFGGITIDGNTPFLTDLCAGGAFLWHQSGQQSITVYYKTGEAPGGSLSFNVVCTPTDDAWQQWRANVWSALYNAAQSAFNAKQQLISSQIQALQAKIANVDTLTLRREEHDEITRGVLQWLLGPGFDFMPDDLVNIFTAMEKSEGTPGDMQWGIVFPGNRLFPNTSVAWSAMEWSMMGTYEQMVRFVNDAIDWDNILYFLYSYFWDVPLAWDNIRNIQHPDATRQAFLRAGSARVVLTVRKGWERTWVQFVEGGNFGQGALPQLHPYLNIAQEIQDYDNTNYPGIPPANPGGSAAPDDGAYVATASSDKVGPSAAQVTLTVVSSTGFIVGYTAIIDSWQPYAPGSSVQTVQEQQRIVAVPDSTHITVAKLTNAHDGSSTPFAVIQVGEKGILIAEWFEHTPNSGTDIAIATASKTTTTDNGQFQND